MINIQFHTKVLFLVNFFCDVFTQKYLFFYLKKKEKKHANKNDDYEIFFNNSKLFYRFYYSYTLYRLAKYD